MFFFLGDLQKNNTLHLLVRVPLTRPFFEVGGLCSSFKIVIYQVIVSL